MQYGVDYLEYPREIEGCLGEADFEDGTTRDGFTSEGYVYQALDLCGRVQREMFVDMEGMPVYYTDSRKLVHRGTIDSFRRQEIPWEELRVPLLRALEWGPFNDETTHY